jgi:hypothetical protein
LSVAPGQDGKAQCIDVQTLETVACNLMCVMGKKCVIKVSWEAR